jgi:YD repeat-containing protein
MKKIITFTVALLSAYLGQAQIKKDTTKTVQKTAALAAASTTATFNPKLLPQITPKSPNVAAMERYGHYPVSLYTGIPTIEIPIFSFKVGELTVPISLSYHASGNKVTDNASWVGMGWTLKAGGAISRNVNGIPDEKSGGLLGKAVGVSGIGTDFNSYLQTYNYANISQPSCLDQNKLDFIDGTINGSIDIERDIFTYNIPSKSNSFVIPFPVTTDGCIWQEAEKSRIDYTPTINPINGERVGLTDITLTAEDGYKYVFADQETTNTNYGTSSTSAWLLNKIQGLDPTQSATFTYVSNTAAANGGLIPIDDVIDTEIYKTQIGGVNAPNGGGIEGSQTSENSSLFVSMKLLQQIIFPEGKVSFVTGTRGDGLGQSLDAIEIYSYNISSATYTLVKKYKLNYVIKSRNGGGAVHFLDNVKMFGSDAVELGTYSLQYNPQALPYTKSRSKDYWGYCNNANATANCTLLPPITFTDYVSQSNTTVTTFNVGTNSAGCIVPANRNPDETLMKAWILTQINYPAGGYSTFDFEAHKYLDGNNIQRITGGLRIKQIIDNDGNGKTVTKTYKYGLNLSGNGTYRGIQENLYYKTQQKQKHARDPNISVSLIEGQEFFYLTTTFSSGFTQPLTSNEGSPVTYPFVTEYDDITGTGAGVNGKTEYSFKDNVIDDLKKIFTSAKQIQISNHWQRGQLLNKTVYGSDGKKKYAQINSYNLLYTYPTLPNESPLLGYLIAALEVQTGVIAGNTQIPSCLLDANNYSGIKFYSWKPGTWKLTKSEEYNYDNSDDTKFTQVNNYFTYDANYFFTKTETKEFSLNGYIKGKKYYYPHEFNIGTATLTGEMLGIKQLKARNMLSKPIEEVSFYNTSTAATAATEVITDAIITSYNASDNTANPVWVKPKVISLLRSQNPTLFSTAFSPATVLYNASPASFTSTMQKNAAYVSQVTFNSYDADGNLGGYTLVNGRTDNFVYQSYTHDAVKLTLVTSQTQDNGGANHLSTFNYTLPALGISSLVAPNQLTTTFEYDNFGRLKAIKDNQGYLLKSYQYKYKNGLN